MAQANADPLGLVDGIDIIRAGLVAKLGDQLSASRLDPEIAYLTAEQENPNPFSRVWEVEDWLPFNLKRLRKYLRVRGVG